MPSYSAQAIINAALTSLDLLDQGGTPSVSDSTDALARLNMMIEQWRIQDKFVWSVGQSPPLALVASTPSYTIGPAGTFNTPRPEYIEQALISLPGPNPANPVTHPLVMIGQKDYGLIRDLKALAHIPERLYNDRASPLSTLYLWPVPRVSVATNLILYTWTQIASYATLVTSNDIPDGYAEALGYALAVRLMPSYGVAIAKEVADVVSQLALQAEATIAALNEKARGLMMEAQAQ